MSKFCTTCGASLDDNATFCTSCGASQSPAQNNQTPAASAADTVKNTFNDIKEKVNVDAVKDSLSMENIKNLKTNPNKNTVVALACVGVIALIVIIVICNLLFGGAYKKPIDYMCKAIEKGDAKYLKKVYSDVEWESELDDADEDEAIEEMNDWLDLVVEGLEEEYGEDIKISYSVKKKTKLSKKKVEDFQDELEDRYDEDVKVTKGYKVKVKMKIKGDEDDDENTSTMYVYKVDGKWCLGAGGLL